MGSRRAGTRAGHPGAEAARGGLGAGGWRSFLEVSLPQPFTTEVQRGTEENLLMTNIGENVVRIEAQALTALADRIAGPMASAFQRAVDLMFCCAGRLVVTGMGKSGLIARKIAATLSSTGTPALYLHPVEALH